MISFDLLRRGAAVALMCALVMMAANVAEARHMPFANFTKLTADPSTVAQYRIHDFDYDGDVDIVVLSSRVGGADPNEVTLQIHFNDGIPPFSFQAIGIGVYADEISSALELADLDGDGDLDVIVSADSSSTTVFWHRNEDGIGQTWSDRMEIADMTQSVLTIQPVDMDLDGDLDMLTNSVYNAVDRFVWIENTVGDGTLWTRRAIDNTIEIGTAVRWAFTADLDLNGAPDPVALLSTGDVVGYFSNGANPPGFTKHPLFSLPNGFALFPHDIDRDGDVDIITRTNSDGMRMHLNPRTPGEAWTAELINDGANVMAEFYMTDLDQDGDVDILARSPNSSNSQWLEHAGDSFTRRVINFSFISSLPQGVDFDGDGSRDFIIAHNQAGDLGVAWAKNVEPGHSALFREPSNEISAFAPGVSDILLADLNNDGVLDYAGSNASNDTVHVQLNSGPPGYTFENSVVALSGSAADGVLSLAAGDVNRDGKIDLVSAAPLSGDIRLMLNRIGDTPPFLGSLMANLPGVRYVALGDLDGDGDLDAAATAVTCPVNPLDPCTASVVILRQTGNPLSIAGWTQTTLTSSLVSAQKIAIADMDNDGDMDVVVGTRTIQTNPFVITTTHIRWYENDGANPPAFTQRTVASTIGSSSVTPRAFRVIDFNRDGRMDVIAADFSGDAVGWYENLGGAPPPFAYHPIQSGFDSIASVDAADVDLDGDMDVVVASQDDDRFVVLRQDGGDVWTPILESDALDAPSAALLADLNRDGLPDVVGGFSGSSRAEWFANGGGQFLMDVASAADAPVDDPIPGPEGSQVAALAIEFTHLGRAGDTELRLGRLSAQVRRANNQILTNAESAAFIDSIQLYADADSSGIWEPEDTLAATFDDFDAFPDAIVFTMNVVEEQGLILNSAVGETNKFFLVVNLKIDAANQPEPSFNIRLLQTADDEARIFGMPAFNLREAASRRSPSHLIVIEDVEFGIDGWLLN